jgi:hypothetical protein
MLFTEEEYAVLDQSLAINERALTSLVLTELATMKEGVPTEVLAALGEKEKQIKSMAETCVFLRAKLQIIKRNQSLKAAIEELIKNGMA